MTSAGTPLRRSSATTSVAPIQTVRPLSRPPSCSAPCGSNPLAHASSMPRAMPSIVGTPRLPPNSSSRSQGGWDSALSRLDATIMTPL